MASTSRGTWKAFERRVAADIDGALNDPKVTVKRNITSGANNRRDNGDPRPGDVVLPEDVDAIVECKLRASHAHHKLFKEAKEDAKKHHLSHTLLYTKVKGEHGYLIVLEADLFHRLLEIKEVQEVFKKP